MSEGPPTAAQNYVPARKLQEDCYGRKERIIFAHIIADLLHMSLSSGNGPAPSLWNILDEIMKQIMSLESQITTSEHILILRGRFVLAMPSNLEKKALPLQP